MNVAGCNADQACVHRTVVVEREARCQQDMASERIVTTCNAHRHRSQSVHNLNAAVSRAAGLGALLLLERFSVGRLVLVATGIH
jgi:hypothetical protein